MLCPFQFPIVALNQLLFLESVASHLTVLWLCCVGIATVPMSLHSTVIALPLRLVPLSNQSTHRKLTTDQASDQFPHEALGTCNQTLQQIFKLVCQQFLAILMVWASSLHSFFRPKLWPQNWLSMNDRVHWQRFHPSLLFADAILMGLSHSENTNLQTCFHDPSIGSETSNSWSHGEAATIQLCQLSQSLNQLQIHWMWLSLMPFLQLNNGTHQVCIFFHSVSQSILQHVTFVILSVNLTNLMSVMLIFPVRESNEHLQMHSPTPHDLHAEDQSNFFWFIQFVWIEIIQSPIQNHLPQISVSMFNLQLCQCLIFNRLINVESFLQSHLQRPVVASTTAPEPLKFLFLKPCTFCQRLLQGICSSLSFPCECSLPLQTLLQLCARPLDLKPMTGKFVFAFQLEHFCHNSRIFI